jgi:transposase
MSQEGMRAFSTSFKESAVLRLEAGEQVAAVGRDLKVARKLLYEWRAAWRKLGATGLNRKRGRKPGLACASPDAEPAAPAPLTELARAQARIVELERKIGKQQMDIDFFREALRLIDALERKASATSSTRSSKP